MSPTLISIDPSGGQRTITVTSAQECAWNASNGVNWIHLVSGAAGSGNGLVALDIERNTGSARSGTITVASQTVTVQQAAPPQEGSCSYKLKPNNYHSGRGPDDIDVDVTTDPGCTWTATSTVTWVTVVEGATGPGKGKVRLLVQANDGPARSVVLTIAGQPFALRQDAAR